MSWERNNVLYMHIHDDVKVVNNALGLQFMNACMAIDTPLAQ